MVNLNLVFGQLLDRFRFDRLVAVKRHCWVLAVVIRFIRGQTKGADRVEYRVEVRDTALVIVWHVARHAAGFW